jgi:hypothetical protein
LTAIADTVHYTIPSSHKVFLIISSDGLENPEYPPSETSQHPEEEQWVKTVGKMIDQQETRNLSTRLLRALGGDGERGLHLTSALLTLDYKEDHYQDDTTVLIAVLEN